MSRPGPGGPLRPETRLLVGGHALSSFGSGLTLVLVTVVLYGDGDGGPGAITRYFLVLAGAGAAGPWAALRAVRRHPAAPVTALALTAQALGIGWLPYAPGPGTALVSAALCGAGAGAAYTCLTPMLVAAERGADPARAFAARAMANHTGLAAGVLLSAVAAARPGGPDPLVFLLDAATFLAFAALLLRRRDRFPGLPVPPSGTRRASTALLRHRPFAGLLGAHLAFVLFGMALVDTAVPLLFMARLEQPPWMMTLLVGLLMGGTVAGTLPVARLLSRVGPTRRLPLTGAAGGTGHLLLAAASLFTGASRTALLIVATLLFAVTTCAFGACFQPLVYTAVGAERYTAATAVISASYTAALLVGPPLGILPVMSLPPVVTCLIWAAGLAAVGPLPALAARLPGPPRPPAPAPLTAGPPTAGPGPGPGPGTASCHDDGKEPR
ncbi:MFS transporter [Streptomyces sp. NPDC000594]|uniref:MFS transporter n=1 Tax=Streptomyces sp. NPDC000594 TaxID=3154261 RepID=UPI00331EFFBB